MSFRLFTEAPRKLLTIIRKREQNQEMDKLLLLCKSLGMLGQVQNMNLYLYFFCISISGRIFIAFVYLYCCAGLGGLWAKCRIYLADRIHQKTFGAQYGTSLYSFYGLENCVASFS